MKLVFFLPRQHTNLNGLYEFLSKQDISITSIVNSIYKIEDHSLIKPIKIEQSFYSKTLEFIFKNIRNKFIFPRVKIIYNLINKNDYVILRNQSIILSIYVLFISKFLKKKIILYLQEPINFIQKNQSNKIKYLILSKVFDVLYFTPILGPKRIYSEKIIYLPFFLTESFYKYSKKKNEVITITMIGKFHKRKNHKFFIELTKILNKEIEIKPIIIGSNPQKEIDNYTEIVDRIESLKVKNIKIYKNINNSKVIDILNESHIFILPSYNEPAAFSPYEAMACGNILFLNKDNRIKYNFESLKNVHEFDINNTFSTAKKIINVVRNKYIKEKHIEIKDEILYRDRVYKRYLRIILNNAKKLQ